MGFSLKRQVHGVNIVVVIIALIIVVDSNQSIVGVVGRSR